MKMMLLLVSALALLVSPALANPSRLNLRRVFDLAEKYNKSVNEQFYVEDVEHLFDSGCGDKFFCKVYDILHKHENFTKRQDELELVRNLKIFNANVSCTELLKHVAPTGVEIQLPRLMDFLIRCIRQRNFNANNS